MIRKLLCGVAVVSAVTATVVGGYFLPHNTPNPDANDLAPSSIPLANSLHDKIQRRVIPTKGDSA